MVNNQSGEHLNPLTSFQLDLPNFSGLGFVKCFDNNIVVFDEYFCQAHIFTREGKFIQTKLGLGRGPDEIPTIKMVASNDKYIAIFEKIWRIHLFDKNWRKVKVINVDFGQDKSYIDLEKNPKGMDKGIYEVDYSEGQFSFVNDTTMMVHIVSDHPLFNSFFVKEYYESAQNIATISLNSGKVLKLGVPYSMEYLKYNYIPNFRYSYSTVKSDNIVLSFNVDSTIYLYNSTNLELFKKGGRKVEIESITYPETNSFEEAEEILNSQRVIFPYYGQIHFWKSENMIVRIFKTSDKDKFDFLQMYNGDDLEYITERKIPKNVRIAGEVPDGLILESKIETDVPKITLYTLKNH